MATGHLNGKRFAIHHANSSPSTLSWNKMIDLVQTYELYLEMPYMRPPSSDLSWALMMNGCFKL